MKLFHGGVYRRRDLHISFGGQQQSGISTPQKSDVVLLFTSPSGAHYGYRDSWKDVETFLYFGEGQSGDMEMKRGNKAIRDHERNGKRLLLFEYVAAGQVMYLGEMRYKTHRVVEGRDVDEFQRRALLFELTPVDPESTHHARALLARSEGARTD